MLLSTAAALEKKRDDETSARARARFRQLANGDYVRARETFQLVIKSGRNNLTFAPTDPTQ